MTFIWRIPNKIYVPFGNQNFKELAPNLFINYSINRWMFLRVHVHSPSYNIRNYLMDMHSAQK